ncbi:unnamed protein product, partial [Heterotrigona itama]
PIACYQTKFSPPKKSSKQNKSLSENIKKFLARKEEEERQKALEEKKKRENLLALRDHKAQSRINKHLKVCKAANKSVLPDAIDNENTAVTMAGPSQPDEDDYGYVSQEASAFYNQLMSKYNNTAPQKTIFNDCRKKTIKDIASTKDRVKQALKQQEVSQQENRRKRKISIKGTETEVEEKTEKEVKDEKPKAKRKPMPPPIDFSELLKIAEKKQHEPIVIDVKSKNDEPERLMTKKQMKEYTKEKEWRERKEQRNKLGSINNKEGNVSTTNKPNKTQDCRNTANCSNKTSKVPEKLTTVPAVSNKIPSKATGYQCSTSKKLIVDKATTINPNKVTTNKSERDMLLEERKKLESERKKLEEMRQAIEEEKKKLKITKTQIEDTKNPKTEKSISKVKTSEKQDLLKNIQKESPTTNATKSRVPQKMNDKIKQFPPADLKPIKSRHIPHLKEQKKPLNNKRRITDEEEEDYDSELEDFIDDEVEDENEDYSKYISEIFGYDKNKYKHVDNDDDTAMESSFAQQLKEEYVSTKI